LVKTISVKHVSSPAQEIAEMPWTLALPMYVGEYDHMFPSFRAQSFMDQLEDIDSGDLDVLRLAALRLGETIMALGFVNDPRKLLVDIRSGMAGSSLDRSNFGWHYDYDTVQGHTPQAGFLLCSGPTTEVLEGCLDIDIALLNYARSRLRSPWASHDQAQGEAATFGAGAYSELGGEIRRLKEGVLYYIPKGTVHRSPRLSRPLGRNFFRFKIAGS
jgi:hypothetical protein